MATQSTTRRPTLHPHVKEYAKFLSVPVAQVVQLIRGRCKDAGLVIRFRVLRRQQSQPVPLRQLVVAPTQPERKHEKASPADSKLRP